jgi:alkylation response protein AidB-like acyl-CoA dehydrogenase
MPRTAHEVLSAIDRTAPVIAAEASASERARRATPALVEALHRERLFRLWIPRSLDGEELDLVASLETFEAVSRIDGSAGWTVMIGVGGGLFAAFMDRTGAEEVFLPPDAVIAGSGSPSGRALLEGGAYRASGHWSYASGAHHATWFTANCVLEGTDPAVIRAMSFPARDVEVVPNWDVLGMRGTGSHDFRADNLLVPAHRTFSVFTDEPPESGPLFRFPFGSIAQVSFGSVALGAAAGALEAFGELAERKLRYGADGTLGTSEAVRIRQAEAQVTLAAARAWFFEAASAAWARTVAGKDLPEETVTEVRDASIHAAASSARSADLVFEVARTSVVRDGDRLGRAWRDVHVVRQHALLSPLG